MPGLEGRAESKAMGIGEEQKSGYFRTILVLVRANLGSTVLCLLMIEGIWEETSTPC